MSKRKYNIWFEIGEILPDDQGTKTVFSAINGNRVAEEFDKLDPKTHFIDVWVSDRPGTRIYNPIVVIREERDVQRKSR